ncbi:MAG: hypothetical protein SGJ17_04080 [Hyphomicrobiales bacterium]|nr:hypothetical protein [Hyphomicrobiales bacterium]
MAVNGDNNGSQDPFIYSVDKNTFENITLNRTGLLKSGEDYKALDISADGRFVLFIAEPSGLSGDNADALFVFDRETKRIEVVSYDIYGVTVSVISASISADGKYITFNSDDDFVVENDVNGQYDIFYT